ncbi:NAD-dependent epimerase/dehydratase family protein [Pedobacter sp. ASV28]|uniref:NAD-dependent epimerase/dehydratase family protein n=1 Tax=Pedobacter sp. ASV28 TaxID=2795123 RepID=UPI0018ED3831|nr:NAD-dependent epimerase/dehydratase family protein [Pedobacter sp. ASV28]
MGKKIILTGATGLVGEGVLLACLSNPQISEVLIVGRKATGIKHQKLKELLVGSFFNLHEVETQLTGYDACFYCAGISSAGMNEKDYTSITYDTTLAFAQVLLKTNPNMSFCFVSGSHTDGSEKGRVMWARVKGKTENTLSKMAFRQIYHFRPGLMKPTEGQKNVKGYYKILGKMYGFFKLLFPNHVSTMNEVGQAMINSITIGYPKQILEVTDIKTLAKMTN